MGWMKEVWRLMNEEQMSYDQAIDVVAAQRKQQETEYQERQMINHERHPED